MTRILKLLGFIVFSIWLAGAGVMFVIYEYDRKSECVQKEGWLKGLLWCETDSRTREGLALDHMTLMIKGLGWPFIFSSEKNITESKIAGERMTQYLNILKECDYDPKNKTLATKECVIRKTNQLVRKDSYREASCQRKSNAYEAFSKARDSGDSLQNALQALDKLMATVGQEASDAMGVNINEKQVLQEMNGIMQYVYAHPDKTPAMLRQEQYSNCIK